MKDFIPCENCTKGYLYIDEGIITKCSCLYKYQKEKKLFYLLQEAKIPIQLGPKKNNEKSILNYSLKKDYVGDDKEGNLIKAQKFIKYFDSDYSSLNLYFYGESNTQKSTVGRIIGKELIKKGKSVYYILLDDLINLIIDSKREEDLKPKVKKILNVDLLIIDEFSSDKITLYKSGFQIPFLISFLKKRIESIRKAVLFISNCNIESIGKVFGSALNSLIKRECLDPMEFKDDYEAVLNNFNINDLWKVNL